MFEVHHVKFRGVVGEAECANCVVVASGHTAQDCLLDFIAKVNNAGDEMHDEERFFELVNTEKKNGHDQKA